MNLFRRLRGPAIDDEAVLSVIYYYYLDPQPKRALAAFERVVERGIADQGGPDELASTAWVFGRIAGDNPEIQDGVRRALERRGVASTPYGRLVLETAAAGDDATKQLLARPLTSPGIVAFLGAEIVVTGSLEPFMRMIDALGAPDLMRLRLGRWLEDEFREPSSWPVENGVEVLATDYHIVVRPDPPAVLTVSDCDLLVMVQKPLSVTVYQQGVQATQPVRRPLPVEPDPDATEPLRTKLTAYTEIASGLNQHEGLPERVRSEASRREDPRVRIDLLEALAGYELPKFRFAPGIELMEQCLEIDPYRADLVRLVEGLRRDPMAIVMGGTW